MQNGDSGRNRKTETGAQHSQEKRESKRETPTSTSPAPPPPACFLSSCNLPRHVLVVAAEVAGLSQPPLEVLPRRPDVELGRGLLDEGARGHYHDVRVLGEVADKHGEI